MMACIIQDCRFSFATTALLVLMVVGSSAFSHNSMVSTKTTTTKLFSTAAPMLPEGLVKTVVQGGNPAAPPIGRGDVVTVKYTCYSTSGDDNDDSQNVLLARADSQKMVVGDGSMVPGWDAALRSMAVGERAVVRLTDPSLGYDARALESLKALGIQGSSQLEFDIAVQTVQPAKQAADIFDMDFDAMALADNTPKTAQEIAEAYQVKMANKKPQKEGLEGWIDTVRNWYFFGFFEGETGEEAPWYLRPSITFPIAFAVVGAAFWVSLVVGAISEKGAQSIDELDTIVMSLVPTILNGL